MVAAVAADGLNDKDDEDEKRRTEKGIKMLQNNSKILLAKQLK